MCLASLLLIIASLLKSGSAGAIGAAVLLGIYIQCVSLDSASLIIYPEIKATEVPFLS